MKKRTYIAAVMAVAMAALVGCQKDFEPSADFEQTTDSVARPEIGSVNLVLGAETRAVAGGNSDIDWNWEAGDKVGAALVDQANVTSSIKGYEYKTNIADSWTYADYVMGVKKIGTPAKYLFTQTYDSPDADAIQHTSQEFYTLTQEQTWTNYPYTKEGDSFTTPARLVEGHYVFYAPYNAALATRGPLVVTLPKEQTVTKAEPNKAVADFFVGNTPVVLGMKYLDAANTTSVKAQIGHIFAYPQITIHNGYTGFLFDGEVAKAAALGVSSDRFISTDVAATYTMTIKQIQLYSKNQGAFEYQREVAVEDLYAAVEADADAAERWVVTTADKKFESAKTSLVLSTTNYGKSDAFEENAVAFDASMPVPTTMEDLTQCVVINFEDVELEFGEDFAFNAVIPAEDYTEDGLFARILVTIDGKDYYIVTNDVVDGAYNADGVAVNVKEEEKDNPLSGYAYFSKKNGPSGGDYQFTDRNGKGSNTIVLARGERWPVAEVNEDKTLGTKTHAGKLLTIDLKGGAAQVAVAAYVEDEEPEVGGIMTNEDFITYVKSVNQDAELTQTNDEAAAEKNENLFFLNPDHGVVLNAELISELSRRQVTKKITFIENLPIANDVLVSMDEQNTFTFTAGNYSYTITYSGTTFNTIGTALTDGINIVSTDAVLAAKSDGIKGAVVILKSNASVEKPAGISGIAIESGKVLTVKAVVDAWIQAPEATVTIAKSANVTNAQNVMATVNNEALAAFSAAETTTVTYTCYGFGIDPIPAASKVNALTVNPTTSKTLEIDAAALAVIANLKDVTITFGNNVAGLTSAKDITLTNVKALKALKNDGIVWNIGADNPVEVKYNDTAANKTVFFGNITSGTGVTFTPMK